MAGRLRGQEGGTRREARAILRDKFPDWHPLIQLAETAQDPKLPEELRFQAAKEVTNYLMPKLKAVEVGNSDGAPFVLAMVAMDSSL